MREWQIVHAEQEEGWVTISEKIPLLNKDWNSFKLALEFYSCLLKQMTETTLKYNENNENKKNT